MDPQVWHGWMALGDSTSSGQAEFTVRLERDIQEEKDSYPQQEEDA